MWHIDMRTPEQIEEDSKKQAEILRKQFEEGAQKVRDRKEFIEATTCPHCKRHDPVPPWLR